MSERSLGRARVQVVPELAPYITPIPSEFASVPANSRLTITFVFTVPRFVIPQTLLGSINLVDATDTRKTFALPLPVQLALVAAKLNDIPTTDALPSPDRVRTASGGLTFVKDEVDVFFKEGASLDAVRRVANLLNGTFLGSITGINLYQLLVPVSTVSDLVEMIRRAKLDPSVATAGPYTFGTSFTTAADATLECSPLEPGCPNDPAAALPSNYIPALINLPGAWAITTGDKRDSIGNSLGVAVIDTGFHFSHIDITGNVTRHPATNCYDPVAPSCIHGTAVASVIGAEGNNAIAIAGVMWHSDLRLYDPSMVDGFPYDYPWKWPALKAYVLGVMASISEGARVINFSGGSPHDACLNEVNLEPLCQSADDIWNTLFTSLLSSTPNTLWVFAAGNNGRSEPALPARLALNFDNAIAVSATNSYGALSTYCVNGNSNNQPSNYGEAITVSAPGENVYRLIPGGNWGLLACGATSLAAPYVTGVAGLMLSANPDLSASNLKVLIHDKANRSGYPDPSGNDIRLLDACRAVKAATNTADPAVPMIDEPSIIPSASTPPTTYSIQFDWSDVSDGSCNDVIRYDLESQVNGVRHDPDLCTNLDTTRVNCTFTFEGAPPSYGGWTVSVRAVDKYGNRSLPSTPRTFSLPEPTLHAANFSYPMTQGTTLTVLAPGVLASPTLVPANSHPQVDFYGSSVGTNPPPAGIGSFLNLGGGGFIWDLTRNATTVGTFVFYYIIHTTLGDSNIATVTVTVNPAPSPQITMIAPASVIGSTFSLTISGDSFDAGAVDQIYQPNGSVMGQGTGIQRSADGRQIVVTEHMAGAAPFLQPYVVKVRNSTGQLSNAANLTLNDQVSVTPSSGGAGTMFSYTGAGFTGNFGVTSHLRRPDGTEFATLQIATAADGTFGHVINSTGFSAGTYEVWAIDNNTGKSSAHVTFSISP